MLFSLAYTSHMPSATEQQYKSTEDNSVCWPYPANYNCNCSSLTIAVLSDETASVFGSEQCVVSSSEAKKEVAVCHCWGVDVAECELESLAAADVMKLEADCFWCFSKLLDGIQDNYTFAQPGIQKRVNSLKELVSRIDSK